MMQKLERSLVPFELFDVIGMRNDKQQRSGEVIVGENTYHYEISYDYKCIGHDVYDATLTAVDIKDKWTNLLMGYNKFKVVMDHHKIKTIYSDHEDYFQKIIEMFENNDMRAYLITLVVKGCHVNEQTSISIETNINVRTSFCIYIIDDVVCYYSLA
jgi:hypothetical protein